MRRYDLESATRLRDAMKFRYERKHVRHMLDHVIANDQFKLIVSERIRKDAEIVDDVGMTARVSVDTDCAGKLILATANVQNSLGGFGHAISFSRSTNSQTGPG